MTTAQAGLAVRDAAPERIAALGGSALAAAIALSREREAEAGEPACSFNATI